LEDNNNNTNVQSRGRLYLILRCKSCSLFWDIPYT